MFGRHPETNGLPIFIQNTKLFAETILVYHKIMKHPTFNPKVRVKLNFV
jgi:hypothetical protein